MKQIVIIGGGISGLAAAHRIIELSRTSQRPVGLSLLEASSRLGGTIQTIQREDFLLERGPDSFISEKPEALELVKRLQIESRLIQTNEQNRRSFIVKEGKLRPVPEGFQLLAPSRIWPFLTTDIFSVTGKLRMAADLFLPRKELNGSNDESLASFVRRRFGSEALERMAQPMVGGIYTADPELLSLRATLPRFLEMERAHRSVIFAMMRKHRSLPNQKGVSGARYSLFLSLDQGMQVLTDALERTLSKSDLSNSETPKATVRLNTKIDSLKFVGSENNRWQLISERGETFEADAVCLAVPSYVAATLLKDAAPNLSRHLKNINFASTATLNLAYRRDDINHKLDGFGFVVPYIEKRSLIACTFSSVKFEGRAPNDCVLLRAFVGGALQPEMLQLDDDEIVSRVHDDLRDLIGTTAKPLFTEIARWNNSMPQYEVGHLTRCEEIERETQTLPHLALAGNSYRGAGIPDCIKGGEKAAEELFVC